MKFNRDTEDSESAVNLNSNDPVYASNSPRNFFKSHRSRVFIRFYPPLPRLHHRSFIYNFLDSLSRVQHLETTSRQYFSPLSFNPSRAISIRHVFRIHTDISVFSFAALTFDYNSCSTVKSSKYVHRVSSLFHDWIRDTRAYTRVYIYVYLITSAFTFRRTKENCAESRSNSGVFIDLSRVRNWI